MGDGTQIDGTRYATPKTAPFLNKAGHVHYVDDRMVVDGKGLRRVLIHGEHPIRCAPFRQVAQTLVEQGAGTDHQRGDVSRDGNVPLSISAGFKWFTRPHLF